MKTKPTIADKLANSSFVLTRIKAIIGQTALARYRATLDNDGEIEGYIPRPTNIRNPFHYSETQAVYKCGEQYVIIVEPRPVRYEVYSVPAEMIMGEPAAEWFYSVERRYGLKLVVAQGEASTLFHVVDLKLNDGKQHGIIMTAPTLDEVTHLINTVINPATRL